MGLFDLPLVSMAISIIIMWGMMAILSGFVHEAIVQGLGERGRFMRKWLMNQMNDRVNGINWASLIYMHGSVELLSRDIKRPTGNISGKLFAQTLIEVIGKCHAAQMHESKVNDQFQAESLRKLKHALQVLKPSDVVSMVQQGMTIAETRVSSAENREQQIYDEVLKHIETWFSDFEWRMSDWYKRRTKTRLFLLGTLLAVLMHVDSIQLFDHVKTNPESRDKIIAYYETNVKHLESLAAQSENIQASDSIKLVIKAQSERIESLASNAELPVGWRLSVLNYQVWKSQHPELSTDPSTSWLDKIGAGVKRMLYFIWNIISTFFSWIFGALITGFAVSFGAPFWFDLLKKMYTLKKS